MAVLWVVCVCELRRDHHTALAPPDHAIATGTDARVQASDRLRQLLSGDDDATRDALRREVLATTLSDVRSLGVALSAALDERELRAHACRALCSHSPSTALRQTSLCFHASPHLARRPRLSRRQSSIKSACPQRRWWSLLSNPPLTSLPAAGVVLHACAFLPAVLLGMPATDMPCCCAATAWASGKVVALAITSATEVGDNGAPFTCSFVADESSSVEGGGGGNSRSGGGGGDDGAAAAVAEAGASAPTTVTFTTSVVF